MPKDQSFGNPDPFLGVHGHYDGGDLTLLLQEGPPEDPEDRAAIEEIYGDIFGDERMPPTPKSPS